MKKLISNLFQRSFVPVAFSLLIGCGGSSGSDTPPPPDPDADIRITALFDLSGPGQTLGQASKAAVEESVELSSLQGITVSVQYYDTQSDPAKAQAAVEEALANGVSIFLGPQTSSEARQILPTVNEAGALVISQGSTASSLAVANDALYRMIPTDRVEARAIYDLAVSRGASSFITINRQDTGNQGLADSFTGYATNGGSVVLANLEYPTTQTSNFSSLAGELAAVVAANPDDSIAVFLAGFDEVSSVLASCALQPALAHIAFYGGDGSALATTVTADQTAAEFANAAALFPNALLTIPPDFMELAKLITEAYGGDQVNAFALAGFDAANILSDAYKLNPDFDAPGVLRTTFVEAATGYQGVTGDIYLNQAGDRSSGAYAFWGICRNGTQYQWSHVASWNPTSPSSLVGTASFSGCGSN
jgi:branched-chain amino acid transport system substrate-binding protein